MARPKKEVTEDSEDGILQSSEFFKKLIKEVGNEYSALASDGLETGEVTGYVSTGSYALNALLSGSLFGGIALPKITYFAGEPSTGKTFFSLSTASQFLQDHPNGFVFDWETESAISKITLTNQKIDPKRFVLMPVTTVQEFRTQALQILNKYLERSPKDRAPMMFILDLQGGLSTTKEMDDIAKGEETKDMTRPGLLKGAFRVLMLKLGMAQVPMIVTNHVYDVIGSYVPLKKMGGGAGGEYAATAIVFLSKKKMKEKVEGLDTITGAIIRCKLIKSRLSVENRVVEVLLRYDSGLDQYYGLLDLAEKFKVVEKIAGGKYVFPAPQDGDQLIGTENQINKNPEKYFQPHVLALIEAKCPDEFLYGKSNSTAEEEPQANV